MLTVEVRLLGLQCKPPLGALDRHQLLKKGTEGQDAHIWPGKLIGETGQLRPPVTRRVFYGCETAASGLGRQMS